MKTLAFKVIQGRKNKREGEIRKKEEKEKNYFFPGFMFITIKFTEELVLSVPLF